MPDATDAQVTDPQTRQNIEVVCDALKRRHESGRYLLGGCPEHTVDMAIARNIRVGGQRSLQFRLDVFNVFNTVIYNNRNSNVIYRSPTDLTIVNSQTLPDGSVDPTRLQPKNAGFGAATSAQPLRNMQLQIRLGF